MSKTLLTNGRFYTMDPHRPVVEALAVANGRIAAAGALYKVKEQVGSTYKAYDLGGRAVLPSFTDAHIHLGDYALRQTQVDLSGAMTLDHALGLMRQHADRLPGEGWIRGGGWDKNHWLQAIFPTANDLDRYVGDRPVALISKDCHGLWVNSKAMELAGVSEDTPDVPGGRIVREGGQPTGVFLERATELIERAIPPVGRQELVHALREVQGLLHQAGITGVHVPEGPEVFRALQDLCTDEQLKLRVYMMIPSDLSDSALRLGISTGLGDENLRLGPVKVFADGTLSLQTAHLLEPYESRSTYTGLPVKEPQEIKELAERCASGGLAVSIHAIGDAANRLALDALEKSPDLAYSNRVEHAQLVSPEDLGRFGQLNLTASMQPAHLLTDWSVAQDHWGDRCRYAFPFRSLLEAGANLAFGSDAPVEPVDPMRGLYAAVTRETSDLPVGSAWYPDEAISVEEAVRAYTLGPVISERGRTERGALKEGFWADMVVLSHDLIEQPELLPDVEARATYLGGELVYENL